MFFQSVYTYWKYSPPSQLNICWTDSGRDPLNHLPVPLLPHLSSIWSLVDSYEEDHIQLSAIFFLLLAGTRASEQANDWRILYPDCARFWFLPICISALKYFVVLFLEKISCSAIFIQSHSPSKFNQQNLLRRHLFVFWWWWSITQ